MKVTLISVTESCVVNPEETAVDGRVPLTADQLLVYIARVSNPSNQLNTATGPKLLAYCIKHNHWSVFEHAHMTVEIQTSLAIATQILRHRSFTFQQFSQRYATVSAGQEDIELRMKGGTNRQGSTNDTAHPALARVARESVERANAAYAELLAAGVAPECARMVLPQATKTTMYMTGSVRSWIHYFVQRVSPHAQKEHRLVANAALNIFADVFPQTYEAMRTSIPEPGTEAK